MTTSSRNSLLGCLPGPRAARGQGFTEARTMAARASKLCNREQHDHGPTSPFQQENSENCSKNKTERA